MDLALIIDLVLVFIIVISAIIGLIRGFFKSVLSFFGTIVSLIISILLARQVAGLLIGLGPVDWLFGGEGVISKAIEGGLTNLSPVFGTAFSAQNNTAELTAALTAAGIPSFLSPILAGVVSQFNFTAESLTLGQILAPMITNVIYLIAVVLVLFALLKIVLAILNKIFKFLTKNRAISGLNRLFGFIIGALKGGLTVALIFAVLALFGSAPFLAPFNEAMDRTTIAKPFNGFVYDFVENNIDLDKIINDLFPSAKKMTDKEIALYAALDIDYTLEGQSPEDFVAVSDDAKNAVAHFAGYKAELLTKIGGNGFDDAKMNIMIEKAGVIQADFASAKAKLAELKAGTGNTAALKSEINALLAGIDALYGNFGDLAAYSPVF